VDGVKEKERQFVADAIDNALQLELALYFGGHPRAAETAAELAERLGRPREAVEAAADELTAKRLLQRKPPPVTRGPASYALTRGRPARDRLMELAERCTTDADFARELHGRFAATRAQWLIEEILEQFLPFAALRTRQSLALHFAIMGLIAIVLGQALDLPPEPLLRVLLVRS